MNHEDFDSKPRRAKLPAALQDASPREREERAQEQEKPSRSRHYLMGTLILLGLAILSVLITTASLRKSEQKAALLTASELREKAAKEDALALLEIATEGMANGLIEEGRRVVEAQPEKALRLAELSASITSSPEAGELFRRAVVEHPAWCRISEPGNDASNDPLATDTGIRVVLTFNTPSTNEAIKLNVRSVPEGQLVDSLELEEKEWLVAPYPGATELIVTRKNADRTGWRARVFRLSDEGLSEPLLTLNDVVDIAFSNGKWPCFVKFANGEVFQYLSPEERRLVGRYPGVRLFAHPTGSAIALLSPARIIWAGLEAQAPVVREFSWPSLTEASLPAGATIRWGPTAHRFLVYHLDKVASGKQTQLVAELNACDALKGLKQVVVRQPIPANAFAELICETDLLGSRVLVTSFKDSAATKSMERQGGLPLILNLNWNDVARDSVVKVGVKPDSVLRGERLPAWATSLRCAAISPNGSFVVVGSDRRAATSNAPGILESWNLQPLDGPSSAKMDARKLAFGVAAIQRLAYSHRGDRFAARDSEGTIHVYRVRTAPSDGHRLPDDVVAALAPKVRPIGARGRYWLCSYSDQDGELLDLARANEKGIASGIPAVDPILDVRELTESRLLVVSGQTIQLFNDDGETESQADFDEPIISACAGPEITTVLGATKVLFYQSHDLDRIAVIERSTLSADALAALQSMIGSHSDNRSRRSICTWRRSPSGTITALMDSNDTIRTWILEQEQGNDWTLKPVTNFQLEPGHEWHSLRRSDNSDELVVLSGSNRADSPTSLLCYGVMSGEKSRQLAPPKDGWPAKILEVASVSDTDEELRVLFRCFHQGENDSNDANRQKNYGGFAVAVYSNSGGEPIAWHDLGNSQHGLSVALLGVEWKEPTTDSMVYLQHSDSVSLLKVGSGLLLPTQKIASASIDVPPYLPDNTNFPQSAAQVYQKSIQHLLLGGGRLKDFTFFKLPASRLEPVEKLARHRESVLAQEKDEP